MSKARDLANAGTALGAVDATELGYLDGVTSAVQTQINAKQATVSGVNDTEIGYLDGVTSAIQTQINAQIPKSIVTTKGDILAATGSGTIVRQGVGADGTVLTADSAEADGIKWATPAAGGMTLLSTTTLSGASVTISSISQSYTNLLILISGVTNATNPGLLRIAPNGSTNISSQAGVQFNSQATNDVSDYIKPSQNTLLTNAINGFAVSIFNYSSTSMYKPFSSVGGYRESGDSFYAARSVGGYIFTTSAISSLVISSSGGNLLTGTCLIYGVK
jgi:hypothetical protein